MEGTHGLSLEDDDSIFIKCLNLPEGSLGLTHKAIAGSGPAEEQPGSGSEDRFKFTRAAWV